MNKEQQIEEMAKEIEKAKKHIWASVMPQAGDEDYLWHSRAIAEHLMLQGYRKADEVRKETAKEIIDMLIPNCEVCDENWHKGCLCLRATIAEKIAKQYGVEVEE